MSCCRWFRIGDLKAFFALMFDNVANLVILAAILVGAFPAAARRIAARTQGICTIMTERPNPRLQRTGLRLPLSRKPLGVRVAFRVQ